jgi:hypothetical protein
MTSKPAPPKPAGPGPKPGGPTHPTPTGPPHGNGHPESYCHRCGGPNVAWSAPSPLWNAVMRGESINGDDEYDGIVCPTCFALLAEERVDAELWRLTAVRVDADLVVNTTPSGRVWDGDAWLWIGPRFVEDDAS